jgi:hypothetical protein
MKQARRTPTDAAVTACTGPSIAIIRFCRGCGKELPAGTSLLFHPECRKADKRRRVTDQRRREAERRERWLRRQRCPECGASLETLVI